MKKNNGKILVAVLAMAMIFAGCAVVLSDNEVEAVTDFSKAVADKSAYTLSDDGKTLTLNKDLVITKTTAIPAGVEKIEGNNHSIIDSAPGEYALEFRYSTTIVIDKVEFVTSSSAVGEIINTNVGSTLITFSNCQFQVDGVKKAVQINASTTFMNCDFNGSEVVYNDGHTPNLTFTGCQELVLSVATNSSESNVSITNSDGNGNIKIDNETTLVNLILGWNFGVSWTPDSAGTVKIGTSIEVDEIAVGSDNKTCGTSAGELEVESEGSISADRSEVTIDGDANKIAVGEYNVFIPGGNSTSASSINTILESTKTATISSNSTINGAIEIDDGETLYIEGCTVKAADSSAKITVKEGGTLVTDGAYIYMGVDVEDGGIVVNNNAHVLNSDGGITSDTIVGFGDTLTLTGNVPSNATLYVYGTLNTSNLTVAGKVEAYVGSAVNINGTVNVSGAFTMADADLNLTGTINVNGTSGTFNLSGTSALTVAEAGTFTVATGNTLTIGSTSTFTVEGKLDVKGKVSGTVQNKGTVAFDGTSNNAKVVMYDGVSLTVASVSGTLTITDDEKTNEVSVVAKDFLGRAPANGEATSFGNTVTLTDVRGVTVSEEVVTYNDTVQNNKVRSIVGTMTISGDVSVATGTTSGTVEMKNVASTVGKNGSCTLTVGDLTIGSGVTLMNLNSSKVAVDGTLIVTAGASSSTGLAAAAVDNKGTFDVNGTVAVSSVSGIGTINAMKYSVTTEANSVKTTVHYYTTVTKALGVENADEGKLYVIGTVKVNGEQTLGSGTVKVERSNTLIISENASLTIASGALLDISGTVTVTGVLVITDNTTGLSGTPDYDVKKTVNSTDTYSGIAYALTNASNGETITLAKDVTLGTDTTIPEGVTLATGRHNVIVDKATLTVDGTLAVQNSGNLSVANSGKIVVNGVVSSTSSKVNEAELKAMIANGAFFSNGNTKYASNVAYAAENIGNGTNIDIKGEVSTGDVTFAAGNSTLEVNVVGGAKFTAGTVTLDGASLNLVGTMTGTVEAAAADGTASVVLDKASGFANNALVIKSRSTQNADGTKDYLYVSGKIDSGVVTVSSGTVTVNDSAMAINSTVDGSTKKGALSVASGATLDIPQSMKLVARVNGDDTVMTVDGTINVDGTLTIAGITSVSGTVKVNDGGVLSVEATTTVTGTISGTVAEGESATITVKSPLIIGTKITSLGATGALVGTYTITNPGYIKAYAGSDLSGAKINPTSTKDVGAESTEFYVNDVLYMAVYAESKNITLSSILGSETFELAGYECDGLTEAAAWENSKGENVNNIGDASAVYATVELSKVDLKISIGPNMTVYIDGIRYSNAQKDVTLAVGNHTILVQINPGLTGTTTIQFNGQTVSNGTLIVTPDMADAGKEVLLSVTGELAVDTPSTGNGGNSSSDDDGMGLTDILLIVLVVLIAVMAVMVALRLMRS